MTTIVYCHRTKQIATDSRATMGTRIVSDHYNKHHERDGHHFFVSCSIQDVSHILDAYFEKSTEWSKGDFSTLIVTPTKEVFAFYNVDTKLFTIPIAFNDAYGSGGEWALAALDFGRTVGEAIYYAATKDNCTGGPAIVFDIATSDITAVPPTNPARFKSTCNTNPKQRLRVINQ